MDGFKEVRSVTYYSITDFDRALDSVMDLAAESDIPVKRDDARRMLLSKGQVPVTKKRIKNWLADVAKGLYAE